MKPILRTILLRPASWLYGAILSIRNKLYDLDVLHSSDTAITSIGIGNITVGGTGKTPHTEYLIRHIIKTHNVAYLSRGYQRKTKGFVLAGENTTYKEIGDEATQIYSKYGITTAVDANRHHGISKIQTLCPTTDIVLLDDIYQHRSVHPDLNILLIDYNRPIQKDSILPYGRLRESATNTDRADIIIVTKCPPQMQEVEKLTFRTQINPYPYQNLYFTTIDYLPPTTLDNTATPDIHGYELLIVTGIAQPQHLHNHLKQYTSTIHHISYPDHHTFTQHDIQHIVDTFSHLAPEHRAIIITEKDAARLPLNLIPDQIRPYIYIIGITPRFLFDTQSRFDQDIDRHLTLRCHKTRQYCRLSDE